MKILHLGWGYLPFRFGGLIEYAEDLMQTQARNGHQVSYFCTGKSSIFYRNNYIKKWRSKKGFNVIEVINPEIISGLDKGINQPQLDITEPILESIIWKVIEQFKPDIIHYQEFIGIPTGIVARIHHAGIKTVFTVHDYFLLCPTLKLILPDGQFCRLEEPELGTQCARCCVNAPVKGTFYKIKVTFRSFIPERIRKSLMDILKPQPRKKSVITKHQTLVEHHDVTLTRKAETFNSRRGNNLNILKKIDLILPVSHKVNKIFNYYQQLTNVNVLHITLEHIAKMRPLLFEEISVINFALINVMGSIPKGKQLMLDVFEHLLNQSVPLAFKFTVLGNIDAEAQRTLRKYPFVEYKGEYDAHELGNILEESNINVGIVASLWEEAYGLVGIEFMAKGIPVIGNNIGGIPDYVIEGKTGWLNQSCSAREMLFIINNIINNPDQIISMNTNLLLNRKDYIKTMDDHYNELNHIYQQLLTTASSDLVN